MPIRFGIPSLDALLGRRSPQIYQHDMGRVDSAENPCGIDVSPQFSGNGAGHESSSEKDAGRESLTVSVIGSDGTGKSILAMHLAAKYLADRLGTKKRRDQKFRVIYASTDLSISRARATWENFDLGFPESRIENPFDFAKRERRAKKGDGEAWGIKIELSPMLPFGKGEELTEPLGPIDQPLQLHYLDLASSTSGDDWGYLNRLVASLEGIAMGPCHLLVVDTVDDLELMVGERDAHGARRDRRSRIAELIRTAAGKCHLVLLSGDQPQGQAPEEYISDVVVRLGFRAQREYQRRVVSVEKVRGQGNIRGDHDLTIRSGIGGSTGKQEHFDDPRIVREMPSKDYHPTSIRKATREPRYVMDMRRGELGMFQYSRCEFQSYVYVFHSLHYLNNSIMRADGPSIHVEKDKRRYARFGITHLDDLFDFTPTAKDAPERNDGRPAHPANAAEGNNGARDAPRPILGIPTDEPAALIGEDGTHKSALSKAFLSRAQLPEKRAVDTAGKSEAKGDDEAAHVAGGATAADRSVSPRDSTDPHGVAILLTTKTLDTESLLSRLNEHLPEFFKFRDFANQDAKYKKYRARVICRRFDYHHITSAVLLHIVAQAVRAAQRIIEESESKKQGSRGHSEEIRRSFGWRIRLVIDNWASLREMCPEVKNDPLFLPGLLFYLRREGIATLIVGNEDRGFSESYQLDRCRELRDLTSIHLLTWHTPFFGQNRVAIAVSPPVGRERVDAIRELSLLSSDRHVPPNDDCKIAVNPSFELYQGIQERAPKYVPLRVHLYGGGDREGAYFPDARALFGQLVEGDVESNVVRVEKIDKYELLREFSQLQGPTRFPYTLVLQVDEFWAKTGVLHLRRMDRYLKAQVACSTRERKGVEPKTRNLIVEDPFDVFQPTDRQANEQVKVGIPKNWRRADLLTPPGYSLHKHIDRGSRKGSIVKVPYAWDFGFLMCHHDVWSLAAAQSAKAKSAWQEQEANGVFRKIAEEHAPVRNVAWREFTAACREVAAFANGKEDKPRYVPFALAPEAQESLSCLLLEIWASEVAQDRTATSKRLSPRWPIGANVDFDRCRHDAESDGVLGDFAENSKLQLYRALCLLYELIPPDTIGADNQLIAGPAAGAIPVAVRSWYSTAAEYQCDPHNWYVPARLPGRYSTRGDWFLAVARGSRSYRMGEGAIDLLSTRRANIIRLQAGIGLPVRDNDRDRTGLWTSLWAGDRKSEAIDRISYQEFIKLGGPATMGDEEVKNDKRVKKDESPHAIAGGTLAWLWRSRIKHYDRHARVFRRWICWILHGEFRKWAGKETGLDLYDKVSTRTANDKDWWFHSAVDRLRDTLRDATIQSMRID